MLLPPIREKGDVREQVNRGLKDIERVITAKIVKAVPRVAALNVAAIALSHGIQPALMPVTGNAVFIESDEHGVVVFLCPVPGFFTAFVDELLAHEGIEYLTVDAPLLQQVGIHTAHGLTLWRQHEGLCRRRLLLLCRRVTPAEIIAQQHRHSLWVTEPVKLFYEADGSAALFRGMVEPLTAADGDAVVAGKAFVPAGGNELFSSAAEELLQVHRRGSFFLLGCKRNVL